jgi:hypothetical protein
MPLCFLEEVPLPLGSLGTVLVTLRSLSTLPVGTSTDVICGLCNSAAGFPEHSNDTGVFPWQGTVTAAFPGHGNGPVAFPGK